MAQRSEPLTWKRLPGYPRQCPTGGKTLTLKTSGPLWVDGNEKRVYHFDCKLEELRKRRQR